MRRRPPPAHPPLDHPNLKGDPVPRIIVTTDSPGESERAPVLLDELVQSVHLSTGHAAAQLIERLAWAISDAEEVERVPSDRQEQARRQTEAPRSASAQRPARRRARHVLAA
jgi:hypothetical protein